MLPSTTVSKVSPLANVPSLTLTTPDVKEAMVKEEALNRSKKRFILCDKSKFGEISSITFANIKDAKIITTSLGDNIYKHQTEILEVGEWE